MTYKESKTKMAFLNSKTKNKKTNYIFKICRRNYLSTLKFSAPIIKGEGVIKRVWEIQGLKKHVSPTVLF